MTAIIERNTAPGVHRVDHAYVNWYAIEDGDELTVVDAGLPRSWSALERLLRLLRKPVSAVSALVLTHAHFDHTGFAARLQRRGVPVLVHEADAGLLGHPLRYQHEAPRSRYLSPGFARALGSMALAGMPLTRGTTPTATFADGDVLDVPGRPRVLFTPGHTFGHCSLHLPEAGTVIAGDAIVTWDLYSQRLGPRIVAAGATASIPEALDSLGRFEALEGDTLLPGHGDPWHGAMSDAAHRARQAGAA
jgi:glyoxylase-like metal-dependent hydrolase (beta-lactamase superfamily II)